MSVEPGVCETIAIIIFAVFWSGLMFCTGFLSGEGDR